MSEELEKVKAKIRAMAEKTVSNGCTEAEATTAFKKIGELLEMYNLEMSEVDLRAEECVHQFIKTSSKKRTPVDSTLVAIGKFCDVIVWHNKRKTGYEYHFYGLESDVQMAMYLADMIEKAIATEARMFKETPTYKNAYNRRGATYSFYHGMTGRISHRLNDMKDEINEDIAKKNIERGALLGSEVKSLVLVKDGIVKDRFKKMGIKLYSTHSYRRTSDYDSYQSGHEAGNKVNLSRPVAGGRDTGPKLLK